MKKKICSALIAALCAFSFTACSSEESSGSQNSSSESKESSVQESSSSTESSSSAQQEPEIEMPDEFRVAALKGPTAMGMVKLMDDNETEDYGYEFKICGSPDEISPNIANGSLDIACVPANLGSVLYNKTGGKVQCLAVNTLGVLYIVENGNSVHSVKDLRGKTLYSAGKGSTPEYALNYILGNSIFDMVIEWNSEHSECLAKLLAKEGSVAMLPQPFVTTALEKNPNIRVAIDLNDAWNDVGSSSQLITGAVIVRKEFAEKYPDAVNQFLERYAQSVDFVNGNVEQAAQLVGKYGIVTAEVAQKAIPECHIVCITGDKMKQSLSGYLQVLYDSLKQSVGGTMPGDDFYYGAK